MVGQLSQYCSEPTVRHWNAILRVFRYLKGTIDYSISYGIGKAESPKLQGFSDADFAGDIVDRRSTIGHLSVPLRPAWGWSVHTAFRLILANQRLLFRSQEHQFLLLSMKYIKTAPILIQVNVALLTPIYTLMP